MFFRVENLGPLREAEVDLSKGLILLTGPNNTGKTYLAWSIYGLFRNPSAPKTLRPILDELLASSTQSVSIERIREVWPSVLEEVATRLGEKMHHCFGAPKMAFPNVRVTLRNTPRDLMEFARSQFSGYIFGLFVDFSYTDTGLGITAADGDPLYFSQPVNLRNFASKEGARFIDAVFAPFSSSVFISFLRQCTLLPADRSAVDVFAKELASSRNTVVRTLKETELDGEGDLSALRQVGRYPWPIEDSLATASNLSSHSKGESNFADLAVELETLLGGAVTLSTDGEFRFATNQHANAPIAIHLSSSVVKSLVSLVFFLRHQARAGNVLMIDEPELNLHPDNQRLVTRILAKAVNRGLRVIMSTHSDYILREINNLILLSRDNDEIKALRENYGYSETELLSPEKVGPYLFRNGGCEAIPVTEDGFTVKTIEDEINKLNEISQAIYAALL